MVRVHPENPLSTARPARISVDCTPPGPGAGHPAVLTVRAAIRGENLAAVAYLNNSTDTHGRRQPPTARLDTRTRRAYPRMGGGTPVAFRPADLILWVTCLPDTVNLPTVRMSSARRRL